MTLLLVNSFFRIVVFGTLQKILSVPPFISFFSILQQPNKERLEKAASLRQGYVHPPKCFAAKEGRQVSDGLWGREPLCERVVLVSRYVHSPSFAPYASHMTISPFLRLAGRTGRVKSGCPDRMNRKRKPSWKRHRSPTSHHAGTSYRDPDVSTGLPRIRNSLISATPWSCSRTTAPTFACAQLLRARTLDTR